MDNNFKVSLEEVVEKELSFEAYFILWCLYHKKQEQIYKYVENCRKIPTDELRQLETKGYIFIDNSSVIDNNITTNHLRLSSKGKELFELADFETLFSEFRKYYPNRVAGKTLHQDLKRCKVLYKKIIGNNIEMHNLMCKCAKLYHEEKKRSGSEQYIQMLPTWLHQENYLNYMDDAKQVSEVELEGKENNLDDI